MVDVVVATQEGIEEVAKVPGGIMRLLRQSYDTRERQLDWLLAAVAVAATCYAFWPQITRGVKQGKAGIGSNQPDMVPNDDTASALPRDPGIRIYTYNMPPARNLANRRGPTSTAVPRNPSLTPDFPTDFGDE